MDRFPQKVYDIVRDCAAKHPNDTDAAVEQATARIKRLHDFDDLIDMFVERAITTMVGAERGKIGKSIREGTRRPWKPSDSEQKICPWNNKSVQEHALCALYDIPVGGRRLGSLKGCELLDKGKGFLESGRTNAAKGWLLVQLAEICPPDKIVDVGVPERAMVAANKKALKKAKDAISVDTLKNTTSSAAS